MNPRVSVIIPVRNGERTLARAIDSALAQTYSGGVEIIVVDNGSTDATGEVIRSYGSRIRAILEPNPGVSKARNVGIAASRGQYIALLDSDDEWMPEKLARTSPLLEDDPACVLAYHDAIEVNPQGRVVKNSYYPVGHNSAPTLGDLLSGTWRGLPIPTCNVLMRREVVKRVGGFDQNLPSMEDFLLWIRLREQGRFRYLPQALARREWEPSCRREEWYLAGGRALYEVICTDYGKQVAAAHLVPLLVLAGKMAQLRGQRALAARRYLSAIRVKPNRIKSWARLATIVTPTSLMARLESKRHARHYGPSDLSVSFAASARN